MQFPKKKKQSVIIAHRNKIFLICIALATLLLGIGYAQLTQQTLFINADADNTPLEEVVITSVSSNDISIPVYTSNSINSTVTLSDSDPTDTASMTITVYNNSSVNQYFLGASHDSGIGYTNQGIEYTISGLDEEELIQPGESKTFTVTFSYKDGQLQSSNTLTSFIQYNFSPLSTIAYSGNSNSSATYAGAPIAPNGITVSTPNSGSEIKYGTTDGVYDSNSVPTFTNAGTYTVYYQIKADGYLTETGSYTFTINKATPVITLSSNTGTVVAGSTMTFTATVSSGATSGNAAGTLSVVSADTSVATVSPASSSITASPSGLATTETVTGVADGTSTITVSFTPTDTDNYNNATSVTYAAEIVKSATIPTDALCEDRTYNGSSQDLTSVTSGTGYTLSNYSQTNAGDYTITATLAEGYRWSDNETSTKSFTCTISKATPVITLSAASGEVVAGSTGSFIATVSSGCTTTASGTLFASSSATSYATVSPASSNITANTSGVAVTETITGVDVGSSTITVSFTPTDTTNFNSAVNKTYSVTVKPANMCVSGDYLNNCLIYNDTGTRVYNDAITTINNKTASDFTTISTTDEGLKAIADYSNVSATTLDGTSYYYRGAVEDNWVSFAGYLWRVVRINGDGSVRLIYSGTTSNYSGAGAQIGTSAFNSTANNAKYIGYTYDNNGTETDSTIKGVLDTWYENNLKGNYEGYLSNEIFCNDRNIADDGGYIIYNPYSRWSNKTPSLLCTNQSDRYTLKVSGLGSIPGTSNAGNNLLDYPIGLLSSDEAYLGGGRRPNNSYYLYTGEYYWLSSPFNFSGSSAYVFYLFSDGDLFGVSANNSGGVRPVINLKSTVKYASGKGTVDDPYVIAEIPTPTITLSSASGNVDAGDTTTFIATVTSSSTNNIAGTLTVSSSDASKATVNPTSTNVTATQAGVATTITVTGIDEGNSTITVSFTPTDTSYYMNAENKTYTITVIQQLTLSRKMIMDDYGSDDYAAAITAINNKEAPDFAWPSGYLGYGEDTGLYATADYSSVSSTTLDGTSYYYRGAANNTVSFAGFLWDVVRINGDGSIRMIYRGTVNNHTGAGASIGNSRFNDYYEDSKYVGYTYNDNNIEKDSTIKKMIDTWYENNLRANYEDYLANEIFCYDRSYTTNNNNTIYGASNRLVSYKISQGDTAPTLQCANQTDRYTLKASGNSSISGTSGVGNNLLDYPIGLLTADEAAFAGANLDEYLGVDTDSYITTGQEYWLGSPSQYNITQKNSYVYQIYIYSEYDDMEEDYYYYDGAMGTILVKSKNGVRPVINLKPGLLYSDGDGTMNNPYTIIMEEKTVPTMTLSATEGNIVISNTTTFTATVSSGEASSIPGVLTVTSWDTSIATVSPASTNITATPSGVSTTITVTGVSGGTDKITVLFTPTDTTTYGGALQNYTINVNPCISGDTIGNCLIYADYGTRNYSNATTAISNKTAAEFSRIEDTDKGLYAIEDYSSVSATTLDGTSYYYRGDAEDNWVSFAGFLWRVVRINGDGSVRMIYSGTDNSHTGAGTQINTSSFNNTTNNSKYVGYMYDTNTNSTIKGVIDTWYENNLKTNYEKYLSNEIFCNDRSGSTSSYGARTRLYTNKTPSLQCTNQADRFTLKVSGLSSIAGTNGAGNNLLNYPIGLLTADEVALAGGKNGTANGNYYLYTGVNYWLSSPWTYSSSTSREFYMTSSGNPSYANVTSNYGVRPVINLRSNIEYASGNGTENDPYLVQDVSTPTIILSSTEGTTVSNGTTTFTATVYTSIPGVLTVSSSDTTKATVTPTSTNLTSIQSGVATTITVTGVYVGSTTITVNFTPTDTVNYSSAESQTYTVTVTPCLTGDTLTDCLLYSDYGYRNATSARTAIQNKVARDFSTTATTDEGLHAIADYSSVSATTLDGTSYYYRGDAEDNWVSFAGFLWRVVRINGDGSVRMIYSGTDNSHTGAGTQINTSSFNNTTNNSKYVGYMYDTNTNSTIKGVIDTWYENNLKTNYEKYLSNEIFCNDRSGSTSSYGARTRLYTNKTPSLQCTNQADRFTLKVSGLSSIAGTNGAGNNLLNYPIGLLTADEVALAGGKNGTANGNYYLYTGVNYWLSSPWTYSSSTSREFYMTSSGYPSYANVTSNYGVRPVLNLKPSVEYASGNGTVNNPYILKQETHIELSATSGSVSEGASSHFTVKVASGNSSTIEGTLTISSNDTTKATVFPTSKSITATTEGVLTDIAVTGVASSGTTITVSFTPTDTANYTNATDTYTVTVSNPCTSGDTLADCLLYADYGARSVSNAKTAISNKLAADFSTKSEIDDGLHAIADYSSISSTTLDGTSYYYRGATVDNWVSFAGYYWRIVRINGDGSIRLLYSGTSSSTHTGTDAQFSSTSGYNSSNIDPKYVGYTYDNNGTETNSTIKGVIDSWYSTNIKPSYEGYLSNGIFCNDRSVSATDGDTIYYGAYNRLRTNKTPSLGCVNNSDKYTLKISPLSNLIGTNGVGNNLLDYPVGLLTADEVSLAGGVSGTANQSYYLITGQDYWLGTPFNYAYHSARVFIVGDMGTITIEFNGHVTPPLGVRPVLNLNASIKYDSGNGTENSPYTVKL